MIIELSNELHNVLNKHKNPLLQARVDAAICRIKIDIGCELIKCGVSVPTNDDIDKIYYGIPEEQRNTLIAAYCNM